VTIFEKTSLIQMVAGNDDSLRDSLPSNQLKLFD
jgi:hypothetical protein